jgi:acyl carrier protein
MSANPTIPIADLAPAPDATDIRRWLLARVAAYLDVPVEEVDPDRPLAELGLDSVLALQLSADIEDELDVSDDTLAWDHPTISAIARHLADLVLRRAAD